MLHHWTQHDCNAARKAISPTCRSALQRSHPGKSEPNICSIWSSCFDFQWISKIIFEPFHSQQMRCRFLHGPCIFWSSNLLFHFRTISYGIGNTTQTSNTHTHTHTPSVKAPEIVGYHDYQQRQWSWGQKEGLIAQKIPNWTSDPSQRSWGPTANSNWILSPRGELQCQELQVCDQKVIFKKKLRKKHGIRRTQGSHLPLSCICLQSLRKKIYLKSLRDSMQCMPNIFHGPNLQLKVKWSNGQCHFTLWKLRHQLNISGYIVFLSHIITNPNLRCCRLFWCPVGMWILPSLKLT